MDMFHRIDLRIDLRIDPPETSLMPHYLVTLKTAFFTHGRVKPLKVTPLRIPPGWDRAEQ